MRDDLPYAEPEAPSPGGRDPLADLAARSRGLSRDAASVSTVAAVLTGMLSLLTLVPGIILVAGVSSNTALAETGVALVLLALTGAVSSIGLLRQAGWAWPAAVTISSLQVLVGLLRFAIHEPAAGPVLALLLGGFCLYYLFRLEVRAVFGRD